MDISDLDFLESLIPDLSPQKPVFEDKTISSVAKFITSDECRNIFVMLGAGVSTSAGIPDFRSPGTGLYSNLARLNLPYPEAVFEINFFRNNPLPFYSLAKELYPGKFRPTISHSFVKLLADKSLLRMCFTQNIDTLERRAGVPDNKIVEAHGSFATQRCIDCKAPYDGEKIKQAVHEGTIPRCEECGGLVKPDIVFFGEALPDSFIKSVPMLSQADLLIIMGTSLTVHPFASLSYLVPEGCPRVLINLDPAGNLGHHVNDVVLLGKCDDIVRDLCKELGWEDELLDDWEATKDTLEKDETTAAEPSKTAEEEIDELVADVQRALEISDAGEEAEEKKTEEVSKASASTEPRTEESDAATGAGTVEESQSTHGPSGEDRSPPQEETKEVTTKSEEEIVIVEYEAKVTQSTEEDKE
ncbi:NAD-dependent deacetylase sirtuin-2 [Dentipellis sp. KUC8613]|nr:NAD-dependent deacetylase sirtuin-2 [Dentipellis sp. KUC8613]